MAAAVLAAGCSVSLGGPGAVPKADIEEKISTEVSTQAQVTEAPVECPDDLEAEIGTTLQCVVTDTTTGDRYPVDVRVDSVDGDNVNYRFDVRPEPLA